MLNCGREKIFPYLAGTIYEFSGGINGKDLFSIIQMQIERVDAEEFLFVKHLNKKKLCQIYRRQQRNPDSKKTKEYEYGFYTDLESGNLSYGLNEISFALFQKENHNG
jgi:hypothetical protein